MLETEPNGQNKRDHTENRNRAMSFHVEIRIVKNCNQ